MQFFKKPTIQKQVNFECPIPQQNQTTRDDLNFSGKIPPHFVFFGREKFWRTFCEFHEPYVHPGILNFLRSQNLINDTLYKLFSSSYPAKKSAPRSRSYFSPLTGRFRSFFPVAETAARIRICRSGRVGEWQCQCTVARQNRDGFIPLGITRASF